MFSVCSYDIVANVLFLSKKQTLGEIQHHISLPSNLWYDVSPTPRDKLAFIKMQEHQPQSIVTVYANRTWSVTVHGQYIPREKCTLISKFPPHLTLVDLQDLLSTIDKLQLCVGHSDEHFVQFIEAKGGKLLSLAGTTSALLHRNGLGVLNGNVTIRSADCQVLTRHTKCPQCVNYRNTLRAMYHKWEKRNSISTTSSHANDRWLTMPEQKAKSALLRKRVRSAEAAVKYLKKKIHLK